MNRANSSTGWVINRDGSPGWTSNVVTGCLHGCQYCFAKELANGRLKPIYSSNLYGLPKDAPYEARFNPFWPRFWPERLEKIKQAPIGCGIFPCIMGELFGPWVPREWQDKVFEVINYCSDIIFYLLTKQPRELLKFSPFPKNCVVGVSATGDAEWIQALAWLAQVEASVKMVSVEPLLTEILTPYREKPLLDAGINWLIIGACTGRSCEGVAAIADQHGRLHERIIKSGGRWTLQPEVPWVENLICVAKKAGIPVYLKDNMVDGLPPGVPFYVPPPVPEEGLPEGSIELLYMQQFPEFSDATSERTKVKRALV